MNPIYPGPTGSMPGYSTSEPGIHQQVSVEVPPHPAEDRSVVELLSALVSQTGSLVRKEIELARTELTGKVNKVVHDAILVGVGGALSIVALVVLVAALVLGLGTIMPMWASAMVVGLVFSLVGAAFIIWGVQALKKVDPLPRATVETLEEDRKWVQQLTHR